MGPRHHAMGADALREADMNQGQPVRNAGHLYEVERPAEHAARPAFVSRSCSFHRRTSALVRIPDSSRTLQHFRKVPRTHLCAQQA
jgi:hypothetical protein